MLKRLIFAASALLAVTLGATAPAAAATRYYGYRPAVTHNYYAKRLAVRARPYASRPYKQAARAGYGRYQVARTYGWRQRGAVGLARPGYSGRGYGYGRGYAYRTYGYRNARVAAAPYRRARFATARRDTAIRNYVGPATAYAPATAPAPAAAGAQVGSASYYGGRSRTASGGFVGAATCAHRTLPFGTRVLVTNLANAHQAVLTVNDRGPFIAGRIIDVSTGAAGILGMLHSGTAPVRVQVVGGRG